jgi:hypothetical protein
MNESKKWFTTAGALGVALLTFSAAALAQTPAPTPSVSPEATASVITGTMTVESTASVTTPEASETVVMTGTASPASTEFPVVPTIPVPTSIYVAGGMGGFPFADPAFQQVWNRTDSLVAGGNVSRTWFWGPGPNTTGLFEQYNEGTNGQRIVQYFDKSRMEVNNPAGDRTNPFFVTNGLLTVELISGFIQVGDADFVQFHSACIPMSGDFGDTLAPTYHAFAGVSNTQAGDHDATDLTGQTVTATIDRNGVVGDDPSKGTMPGVNLVHFENNHNIPQVFWDFLNSSGPVDNGNGQVTNERLIDPWNYASGLPISEAYWAQAKIQGEVKDVLIQAYERRVLTYVPSNEPGFQVEMGNIGQHYFDWRYRNYGYCSDQPISTPTAPVPAPTGTVVEGSPTVTVETTETPGTPGATTTAMETETVTATATEGIMPTETAVEKTPSPLPIPSMQP